MLNSALPVLAANYGLSGTATNAGYKQTDIYSYISTVISAILSFLAVLFFALTLYSGLRWMTSRGNEEMTKKAINNLEGAVIGLVIVLSAYALSTFVFSKLLK